MFSLAHHSQVICVRKLLHLWHNSRSLFNRLDFRGLDYRLRFRLGLGCQLMQIVCASHKYFLNSSWGFVKGRVKVDVVLVYVPGVVGVSHDVRLAFVLREGWLRSNRSVSIEIIIEVIKRTGLLQLNLAYWRYAQIWTGYLVHIDVVLPLQLYLIDQVIVISYPLVQFLVQLTVWHHQACVELYWFH